MDSKADSHRIFGVLLLAPAVRTIWGQEQRACWPYRRKRKRRGLKRKSGTTTLTSNTAAAIPIGCTAKQETRNIINAPQVDQVPVLSSALSAELQPADLSDSNTSMCSLPLADHSDHDSESVEQAVDLNACTAVEYEQKEDVHGVRFVCDEKEGWTPVIGKRSWHKVPARLRRLRVPPHVRASLYHLLILVLVKPLTRTALCTFLLVLMFSTHLTVENQASGLLLKVLIKLLIVTNSK